MLELQTCSALWMKWHVFSFSPQVMLAIGITVLTTILLLANLSVKNKKSTDPLFYGKTNTENKVRIWIKWFISLYFSFLLLFLNLTSLHFTLFLLFCFIRIFLFVINRIKCIANWLFYLNSILLMIFLGKKTTAEFQKRF